MSIFFLAGVSTTAPTSWSHSLARANPGQDELAPRQRDGVHQGNRCRARQLGESLRLSTQNALADQKRGEPAALLAATFDSAIVEAWYRGAKDKAVAIVAAGLRRTPLDSLKPLDRPYGTLARIYAFAGRPDLARPMLAEVDKTTATMTADEAASLRHSILAAIALAEGRNTDAAHEARAADNGTCTVCAEPLVAVAYDRADQPDSAPSLRSRVTSSPRRSYRALGTTESSSPARTNDSVSCGKPRATRPRRPATTRSSSPCGRTLIRNFNQKSQKCVNDCHD